MREIIANWEVDDGYVGKSRPQRTIITESDLDMTWDEFDTFSETEKYDLINMFVQEDFVKKISWSADKYEGM